MTQDWHEHALCKVHLDMHCPEWHEDILKNLDPGRIAEMATAAHAEALYFFAKDCYGNAYYPTEVGHRHRCLDGRDFVAEMLAAGHAAGLPIVAYYSVIWDNYAAAHHDEWRMLDEAGRPLMDTVTMDVGKWHYLCHNTGYADYAVRMVEEIAGRYPVDGFHLDMFNMNFGGLSCYCATCQQMFRDQYGKDLPRTPQWDETWEQFLEFRYRSVERFAQRLRAAGQSRQGDLCVVMNYHGSPNFDWRVGQRPVQHSLFSDLGTGETYTPMLGDMYPGMEARFIRNLVPGKPFEMVAWRMNRFTDFTVKPLAQLRWELFTCAANGGSTMLIDQPFADGRLDPVAYDRMGAAFADLQAAAHTFAGDFVPHVGLYYSCRNRDFYGRDAQADFGLPVMGAYKALTESHLAVDFVFDETVTAERLAAFPLLLLPNVAVLTDAELDLVRGYVDGGGVLVATFDTSLCDDYGNRLDNFRLADVFGVDLERTVDCDTNYVRNLPEPYGHDIDPRYYVLNQGPAHVVRPRTAEGSGDLHDSFFKRQLPDRFFSHNIHPPYTRLGAAVYVNRFGKGTCVYLPFRAAACYAEPYELPEHRRLLRNIVRQWTPAPAVDIDAPLNVEAVVRAQASAWQVHLVAFGPLRQAATLPTLNQPIRPSLRMEEAPLYRATLTINGPFQAARAYRNDTQLEINGNQVRLLVADVHDVVTIERA